MNNELFILIILILYANNMLILTKNQFDVDGYKKNLNYTFKMKDLTKSNTILEIKFYNDLIKNQTMIESMQVCSMYI